MDYKNENKKIDFILNTILFKLKEYSNINNFINEVDEYNYKNSILDDLEKILKLKN